MILLIARAFGLKALLSRLLLVSRSKRCLYLVYAKSFEGILISSAFTATPQTIIDPAQLRITLTINNDVAIDDDLALSYAISADSGFTGGFPFFIPIPRRLTGQDTIQLRITNSAASQNVNVTIWYRNEI
jgi:hypothetical protein